MNIVVVKQNAYEAIRWASKNFGSQEFKVINDFPSTNWRFVFAKPEQASHFALKWM
jgi:hypothetical protein